MAMKVFLSHQKKDSPQAAEIALRLRRNGLDVYIDIADTTVLLGVDDLTAHIQTRMRDCTQLMAVVSSNSQQSWWVPWEIGVATERSYPIASYALDRTALPDYLKKWPYLSEMSHIDTYCDEVKKVEGAMTKRATYSESTIRTYADSFHRSLKSRLGQA